MKKIAKHLDGARAFDNNSFCCIHKNLFESMGQEKNNLMLFFSAEDSAYVREHYPLASTQEIANHLGRTARAIRSHAFQIGVKKLAQAPRKSAFLTPEILEILELIYPEMANEDISEFLGMSMALLTKHATRTGLKKDPAWRKRQLQDMAQTLPHKFQKGHPSWCKGIQNPGHAFHERGIYHSGRHHNIKDVGTLTVHRRKVGHQMVDYLYMKQENNRLAPFQSVMWEEYHQRPLPAGHFVVFKNGDYRDFTRENLLAVTQGEVGLCRGVYDAPFEMLELVKKHSALTKAIAQREIEIKTQP